jgi:hypothetical protein
MADKPLFTMDLAVFDRFDTFKATFDEYAATLKVTLDDWKGVAKAINDARDSIKGFNEDLRRSKTANDNNRRNNNQQDNNRRPPPPPKMDPAFQNAFRGFNEHLSTVATELKGIGKTMLRQAGSYGGAGTQGAVSGAESMISSLGRSNVVAMVASIAAAAVTAPMLAAFAAAPDVANLRRQGMGMAGLNTGEMRAARAAGSWMDNPTQGLQATVSARRDITGPQFQSYAQLFGMRGAQAEMGKDPGKAQFDYLDKAIEKLNQFPENLQDTMAETFGMTNVFSLATIRAWQAMSGKEREEHRTRWEEVSQKTAMSPEDSKKWFDFYDKLKASGEIMEAGIIKKLQPLIGPLGAWVDKFATMVNQDGGVISEWVAEMGKVLDDPENSPDKIVAKVQKAFANFPSFETIKKDLQTLVDAISGFANNPIVKFFASKAVHAAVEHPVATAAAVVAARAALKSTVVRGAVAEGVKTGAKAVLGTEAAAVLGPVAAVAAVMNPKPTNAGEEEVLKNYIPEAAKEQNRRDEERAKLEALHPPQPHRPVTRAPPPKPKPPEKKEIWEWLGFGKKHASRDTGVQVASMNDDAGLRAFIDQHPEALGKKKGVVERVEDKLRNWTTGGEELKPRSVSEMNWGGLAAKFTPPWVRGIYNTLAPTPAESGELQEKYWPKNKANMPTADGQAVSFETGNVGGGWKLPGAGQTDELTLAEQRKQTELLSDIKDHMDKAEAFGAGGGGGGHYGGAVTTGPGGADLTGTGGGAAAAPGGSGDFLSRVFGRGGKGAPAGIRARGSSGGGAGGGDGGGGEATGGGAGGSGSDAKMSDYSPAQRAALMDAMQKQEGYFKGSRSYRNNNPGNMEYGAFAKAHGATGTDGRFAIFPDYQSGRNAQEKLLFESGGYKNLTLGQAIHRWAPASENNVPAYLKTMNKALGGAPAGGGGGGGGDAVAGGAGGGNYAGVGNYNFMGSALSKKMGMGDVTPGGPNARMKFATGIAKGKGPQFITANKYAGPDIAGFLKDLSDAGAPLRDYAGVYADRPMRGSGRPSQHSYGNALDVETGFGSGPDNSKYLHAWAVKHPEQFAEFQAKHHMRNLDTTSGAHMHDYGHFEWSPTQIATAQKAKSEAAVASAAPTKKTSAQAPHNAPMAAMSPQKSEPLGIHQWQMSPRPLIEMHNKTGADMHLSASTMAT